MKETDNDETDKFCFCSKKLIWTDFWNSVYPNQKNVWNQIFTQTLCQLLQNLAAYLCMPLKVADNLIMSALSKSNATGYPNARRISAGSGFGEQFILHYHATSSL